MYQVSDMRSTLLTAMLATDTTVSLHALALRLGNDPHPVLPDSFQFEQSCLYSAVFVSFNPST
jgi:hypothetical protein